MYIVTKNNPYYPTVEYCETLEEAEKQYQEFIDEMKSEYGEHDCQVTMAEVIKTVAFKSDY